MTVRERIDFTGNAADYATKAAAAVDSLRRSMRSLAKESAKGGMGGPGGGGGRRGGGGGGSNQRAPRAAAREQIKLTDSQKDYARGLAEEAKLKRKIDTFDANRLRRMDAAKRKLRGMEDSALGRKPRGLGPALPRQEVGGIGGTMNSMMGNIGAEGAIGAAKMAASVGMMAVQGAAFKESMINGFTVVTKDAGKAKQLWQESFTLSKQLGVSQGQTAKSMLSLMGSGFDEAMTKDMIKGMADLKIVNPMANDEGITRAMMQIKTTGKLQGDELMQLNEAGLSSEKVYKALEKRLGKNRDELLKMQAAGKLLASDVLPAILDSIKETTGKDLGKTAEAAAGGLAAQLARLKDAPERFFAGIDSDAEGFSKLKGLMTTVNNMMDPSTEEGKKFVAVLNEGITVISDMGTRSSEVWTKMKADMAMLAEGAVVFESMGGTFSMVMQQMGMESYVTSQNIRDGIIGGLVGGLVGGLPAVAAAASFGLAAAAAAAQAAQESVWAGVGVALGGAVAQGIVAAMSGSGPKIQSGAQGLAERVKAGMGGKAGLDAHSPSVWSYNLGQDTKQGLINAFGSTGALDAATRSMTQGAVMGPMAANSNAPASLAGSSSSTTMAPVIHVHVNGVSDPAQARIVGAAAGAAAAKSFREEMAMWHRQRAEAA